jgi:phenylacetate-CoA ligase
MEHYDDRETRDPERRERDLFARLPGYIERAMERAPGLARKLEGVQPRELTGRAALARLPVTRKSELHDLQSRNPPFGGFATVPIGQAGHVFGSPGPIYEIDGGRADWARFARPLFAAGFRRGDLVYNTFAYHFTPAGLMVDEGARALGCAVFPAGTGQTEIQLAAIAHLKPDGYVGTPSFLKILLEKAREAGHARTGFRHALVSGEAFPSALRVHLSDLGVPAVQCYTTADLGTIAYESEAREGMIVNEDLILEIVRPGTGEPVPDGEVGEIVVTPLDSPEYPLVRLATGDLSAILPGTSPCGRTNVRIRGWLGRADQSAKVRGMFVHPSQVAEIARRHPEVLRARLVLTRDGDLDVMTLRCETRENPAGLSEAIAETVREVCNLRSTVELLAAGTLPNDGKVIDDARPVA